ncbi:MAG: patatin-like phospholipase family protein [Antricoccus sp.]
MSRSRLAQLALPSDLAVLCELVKRRDSGSEPGARTDRHRIAVVVSGGGMRGGATGGMALALEEAGLSRSFDVAYGTSSGAFIAAAVVHRQAKAASRVFSEDMAKPEFLSLRRLAARAPVMSLDHLIEDILTISKPLPWSAAPNHDVPLRLVATATDDMRPYVLDGLDTEAKWRQAFRATACVPGFAGKAVELAGRRWIDGSVAEPLPVMRAVQDGATHVLALVARSAAELVPVDRSMISVMKGKVIDRIAPGLGSMLQDRIHYTESIRQLSRSATQAMVVANPRSCGVRGFTRNVPKIDAAVELGHRTMKSLLTSAERRIAE